MHLKTTTMPFVNFSAWEKWRNCDHEKESLVRFQQVLMIAILSELQMKCCCTLQIAALSPADINFEETLSTLRFGTCRPQYDGSISWYCTDRHDFNRDQSKFLPVHHPARTEWPYGMSKIVKLFNEYYSIVFLMHVLMKVLYSKSC